MKQKPDCSVCGSPATVFVTFVAGGAEASKAYCATHAQEAGLLEPNAWSLLGKEAEAAVKPPQPSMGPRCGKCGFSLRDFERRGRFGCPDCYKTFARALKPLLEKMHAGCAHNGKIPASEFEAHMLLDRIQYLEGQLSKAISGERYEDAAICRDRIQEIKEQLDQSE